MTHNRQQNQSLKLHNATFPGPIHPETIDFQFLSRFKELHGSFSFGTEYRQGINHCTSNSASTCSDTGGEGRDLKISSSTSACTRRRRS